jgi:hypothetical protein
MTSFTISNNEFFVPKQFFVYLSGRFASHGLSAPDGRSKGSRGSLGWTFICTLLYRSISPSYDSEWIPMSVTRHRNSNKGTLGWPLSWGTSPNPAKGHIFHDPMPSDLDLSDKLFVYRTYHDSLTRESMTFRPTPELFDAFMTLAVRADPIKHPFDINLFTGRRKRKAGTPTAKKTPFHRAWIKSVDDRVINLAALERNIDLLEAHTSIRSDSKLKYQRQQCYWTVFHIKNQGFRLHPDGTTTYKQIWNVASTGRMSEEGANLQGCSRELKELSLQGIEYYNYDIKSSQLVLLHQLLVDFGELRAVESLDRFASSDKALRAKAFGVDVDTYKTLLYALIFGASLSKTPNSRFKRAELGPPELGDIYMTLLMHAKDHTKAEELLDKAKTEFSDLITALKVAKRLVKSDRFFATHGYTHSGVQYLRNQTGIRRPRKEWSAKILAHFLQGAEAAFIQCISVLCKESGIPVIANEHDGLITLKPIPEELIEQTKVATGSPLVQLVTKSRPCN